MRCQEQWKALVEDHNKRFNAAGDTWKERKRTATAAALVQTDEKPVKLEIAESVKEPLITLDHGTFKLVIDADKALYLQSGKEDAVVPKNHVLMLGYGEYHTDSNCKKKTVLKWATNSPEYQAMFQKMGSDEDTLQSLDAFLTDLESSGVVEPHVAAHSLSYDNGGITVKPEKEICIFEMKKLAQNMECGVQNGLSHLIHEINWDEFALKELDLHGQDLHAAEIYGRERRAASRHFPTKTRIAADKCSHLAH